MRKALTSLRDCKIFHSFWGHSLCWLSTKIALVTSSCHSRSLQRHVEWYTVSVAPSYYLSAAFGPLFHKTLSFEDVTNITIKVCVPWEFEHWVVFSFFLWLRSLSWFHCSSVSPRLTWRRVVRCASKRCNLRHNLMKPHEGPIPTRSIPYADRLRLHAKRDRSVVVVVVVVTNT